LSRRIQNDRNVVVVAPTGIAALDVGGYTIHWLFGFGGAAETLSALSHDSTEGFAIPS
jgi:hypothetical protein